MDASTYEYFLHKDDFKNAQRLHVRHNKRAALVYYVWVGLIPIMGVLAFFRAVLAYLQHNESLLRNLAPVAGAGVWLAVFLPLCRWRALRKGWKVSVETTEDGKPVRLQFDNLQLISTIPGKSEGRFYWKALIDFAEDNSIALLYVREKQFLYVPKSALPEAAWEQIRFLAPRKQ